MRRRLRIAIPVVLIIAGIGIWKFYVAEPRDPNRILTSGNIDVTQVDMAFKIPGRLIRRPVDEGERIKKGQLLARLDDTDQQLQIRKGSADLDYARSVLAELESGSRQQEIEAAKAALERAEAVELVAVSQLRLAQSEFDRYQTVYRDGGISRQEFENFRTKLENAKNMRVEAAAGVQAARQQLSLVKEGPRQETLAQARARVAAAEAALNLYKQDAAETELYAPFDGVVLSQSAEEGAYLNPGAPVVTVAQIDRVWLRAFVSESDIGRIRLGQDAAVSTDAYAGKIYPGRVSFISSEAEFTPKSVQTFEERVNLMYRIKIDLDNSRGELKPGMPADAVIQVQQ